MNVFIVAALTADGFIGRDSTHLADWTGKADKKVFVRLTKEAGVMVMGSRTFATIGRALPERHTIVYTHNPDSMTVPNDVETTNEAPAQLVKRLTEQGAKGVAIVGGSSIYNLFMQAGVVDELYITVVPALFGRGVPLFQDTLETKLELLESTDIGEGAVLLHYTVAKH
jgi:dihydrofolate reductase